LPDVFPMREVQQPKGWTVKIEPSEDGEKVATVKWIMDTFANGDCSIRWIAKDLNQRGVAAPRGKAGTQHRPYFSPSGLSWRQGVRESDAAGSITRSATTGKSRLPTDRRTAAPPSWPRSNTRPLWTPGTFKRVQANYRTAPPMGTSPGPAITSPWRCPLWPLWPAMCGQKPRRARAVDTTDARG